VLLFQPSDIESAMTDPAPFKGEIPPVTKLLGFKFKEINRAEKWLVVDFQPATDFFSPARMVHGGMLTAMLDETMGALVAAITDMASFPTTIDLNLSFLRPVKSLPVSVKASIVKIGKQLAFLQGELSDVDGKLCVRANASCLLTDFISLQRQ
jgi:uncharacterized protein (TIGR00369 family)